MSKINETYYAVRCGDPRRHTTFLGWAEMQSVPALFVTKKEAELHARKFEAPAKAVRVRIKCG